VLEFSRLREINTMRAFFELLRERVGSPLSLASLARDLAVSPTTLRRYLEILEALVVVIVVPPWHRNIARALLQAPKVYFNDTGLHYIRTKDGAEVDFCLSVEGKLRLLLECKLADAMPHRALQRFATQFPEVEAVQLVRDSRQLERRGTITVAPAGAWLAELAV